VLWRYIRPNNLMALSSFRPPSSTSFVKPSIHLIKHTVKGALIS
jgi:hypothetical protein